MESVCIYCKTKFTATNKRGKKPAYCSSECRRAQDLKRRKTFEAKRKKYKKRCQYCLICFETYTKEQKSCAKICQSQATKRRMTTQCVICGATFRKKHKGQECCSTGCAKTKEGNTKRSSINRKEREYQKARADLGFRISRNLRAAIHSSLRGNKNGARWERIVGYTAEKLIKHLEKNFKPGMNWRNYGLWHIDHKTPISVFNFTSYRHPDFKRCWSLKNLQPLWAAENLSKNNKLTKPFQPLLPLEVENARST